MLPTVYYLQKNTINKVNGRYIGVSMWVWPFHVHGHMAASGSSHEGYQVHLTESTMDTSSSTSSSSTNWSL